MLRLSGHPARWLIPTGLLAGLMVGVAQSRGLGGEVLPTTSTVVSEGPGWVVVASLPSPAEERWLTAALEQNPALGEMAGPLQHPTSPLHLWRGDKLTPLPPRHFSLSYSDSHTGLELNLDVLEFDTPEGRHYRLDPSTSSFPAVQDPTRPHHLILEWGYQLWSADLEHKSLKPLGDLETRRAVEQARIEDLDDSGHGNSLIWASGPTVSPDGVWVSFASNRSGSSRPDIWLHHLPSGEETLLWSADAPLRAVAWTPSGDLLVQVFSTSSSSAGLWRVDPSSGNKNLLTSGEWMSVSDSGKVAMVTQTMGNTVSLKWLDLESGTTRQVWQSTPQESLRSWMGDFDQSGTSFAADFSLLDGSHHLKVFSLPDLSPRRVDLPPGQQLAGMAHLVGQGMLIPVENLQEAKSSTLWIDLTEGN